MDYVDSEYINKSTNPLSVESVNKMIVDKFLSKMGMPTENDFTPEELKLIISHKTTFANALLTAGLNNTLPFQFNEYAKDLMFSYLIIGIHEDIPRERMHFYNSLASSEDFHVEISTNPTKVDSITYIRFTNLAVHNKNYYRVVKYTDSRQPNIVKIPNSEIQKVPRNDREHNGHLFPNLSGAQVDKSTIKTVILNQKSLLFLSNFIRTMPIYEKYYAFARTANHKQISDEIGTMYETILNAYKEALTPKIHEVIIPVTQPVAQPVAEPIAQPVTPSILKVDCVTQNTPIIVSSDKVKYDKYIIRNPESLDDLARKIAMNCFKSGHGYIKYGTMETITTHVLSISDIEFDDKNMVELVHKIMDYANVIYDCNNNVSQTKNYSGVYRLKISPEFYKSLGYNQPQHIRAEQSPKNGVTTLAKIISSSSVTIPTPVTPVVPPTPVVKPTVQSTFDNPSETISRELFKNNPDYHVMVQNIEEFNVFTIPTLNVREVLIVIMNGSTVENAYSIPYSKAFPEVVIRKLPTFLDPYSMYKVETRHIQRAISG